MNNRPLGLNDSDTIEDALNRADGLSGEDWYSGMLTVNKDQRRIVLLAQEYRKYDNAKSTIHTIITDLKTKSKGGMEGYMKAITDIERIVG